MHANIELCEMQPEGPGACAKVGQPSVCHSLAPMGAEQRVEVVQVGHELGTVGVLVGTEPLPDLDEDRAKRLIVVRSFRHRADHRRRHPPGCAERSQLLAVEVTRKPPRTLESVFDRLRTDVRVAVEVTADPATEAERPTRVVQPSAEGTLEVGNRIPEALLEEPEALADLVLASSCSPPMTPLLTWKGRFVLDGGVVDNVPVCALDDAPGETLVMLTRRYPALPDIPGRTYVQPSMKIPVSAWDYTNADGLQFAYDLGRRDGEAFARTRPWHDSSVPGPLPM